MVRLKDYNNLRFRKIFILDRNDGKCYAGNNKKDRDRLYVIFGDRFLEMVKRKGEWGFFILEVIPGSNKRRIF